MQVRHVVHVFCCAITFSATGVAQPVKTGTVVGVVTNERQGPSRVAAQSPRAAPLDPQVIAVVDRVYPGFGEILELGDSISLARLARTLAANPSMESLTVLLWMLQSCPSWTTGEDPAVLQIDRVVRAVGLLPLASFADGLLNDDAEQRIDAAVVLSNHASYVQPGERAIYERTLIAALSDPNIHVREFAAGPLRELHSPAAARRSHASSKDLMSPTCCSGKRRAASARFQAMRQPNRLFQRRQLLPSRQSRQIF